jgi:Phosphotransferase enzyme family
LIVTTTDRLRRSDEEVLRSSIERIVAEQLPAKSSCIDTVVRRRSKFSSFYASDVITVRFANGDQFNVFLKDFGSFDHPKDTMERRREREVAVYRDLLAGAGLGTARYLGAVRDDSEGRYWLLLEFVEGLPVSHLGFEDWVPAAAWLGRAYGYFNRHRELWDNCDVLMRHDAPYFESIARSALKSVTEFSPKLGRQLAPIVHRYDKAVAVMTGQPQTLVHGTYRPAQIIFDKALRPPRVCPVDFEKAAVGASLYDLTFLVDGFNPPRLQQLFDAYRAEATRCGIRVPDNEEMTYVVDCFRLHRVMNWLAVSIARGYSADVINKLMGMAEELGALVL